MENLSVQSQSNNEPNKIKKTSISINQMCLHFPCCICCPLVSLRVRKKTDKQQPLRESKNQTYN